MSPRRNEKYRKIVVLDLWKNEIDDEGVKYVKQLVNLAKDYNRRVDEEEEKTALEVMVTFYLNLIKLSRIKH